MSKMNESGPLEEMIHISEFDAKRPITLSGATQYGLQEHLLGKTGNGPLNQRKPYDATKAFNSPQNLAAFAKQLSVLTQFWNGVKRTVGKAPHDAWANWREYPLLKGLGFNALMLVLRRILEKYPETLPKFGTYLAPLGVIPYDKKSMRMVSGGRLGFESFANEILKELNRRHNDDLELFLKPRRKRRRARKP
jgi:hypothetical protein